MDEINKKIDPAEKIVRKEAVFVWLDILGFSDDLEDVGRYDELKKILLEFHSLFDNQPKYDAFIISDGILLYIDQKNMEYSEFLKLIKDIGHRQLQFIKSHKKFIRGGISVGSRLMGEDIQTRFISNGLARAVRVESNDVDWPVIGTNEDTINKIRGLFGSTNKDEYFSLLYSFNKKCNNLYFIDFLEQSDREYFELLNVMILKYEDDPRKRSKYIWLMKYYCHKFSDAEIPENLLGVIL